MSRSWLPSSGILPPGAVEPPPKGTSVAVVGLGRVGLPMALALAERGLEVIGVERDERVRRLLAERKMPFIERGCDELLEKWGLEVLADAADLAANPPSYVIVTVGTPLLAHIEADLTQITAVARGLAKSLRPGQTIVLRSTVAARTTSYVARFLERETKLVPGRDFSVAFCPERLIEGKALEELLTLPQVIGADDDLARSRASKLFAAFPVTQLHTSMVGAELVKLFNNVTRYVSFALANQFALIADGFDEDIHPLIAFANHQYPRDPIATPGFAAGSCLRKDFGMVTENHSTTDMLVAAWRVNEYMPNFMSRALVERAGITGKVVAVLGHAFKRDSDDPRDSLTPKLLRYLEREVPRELRVVEPNIAGPLPSEYGETLVNWPLDRALDRAEVVVIAVNHSAFAGVRDLLEGPNARVSKGAWVADLWNVCGTGRTFFQVNS